MKRGLFVIVLMLICSAAFSQRYYWQSQPGKKKLYKYITVDGGVGLRMYFGDIQQPGAVFNKPKLAYGLGVKYQWRPRLSLAAQFEGRGYKGYREHGGYPDALDQMDGKLWGGHMSVNFHWLKWEDFSSRSFTDRDPVTKGSAYIGAGFGGSMFTASYTSRVYEKMTVTYTDTVTMRDTSVTDFFPVDNSGSAGGFGMYVPIVFGVNYRFNPSLHIGYEMMYQLYINKNLDALATKKFDALFPMMVRVGYTFGQAKRKGEMKLKKKSGRRK